MFGFKTFTEKQIEQKGRAYDHIMRGGKDREVFLTKRLAERGEALESLRSAAQAVVDECSPTMSPSLGAIAKLKTALEQ
jgi:hypothetical protein